MLGMSLNHDEPHFPVYIMRKYKMIISSFLSYNSIIINEEEVTKVTILGKGNITQEKYLEFDF